MCGHDGHITALLGGVALFCANLSKIPKNHILRLLFQPAEEHGGGALRMIK